MPAKRLCATIVNGVAVMASWWRHVSKFTVFANPRAHRLVPLAVIKRRQTFLEGKCVNESELDQQRRNAADDTEVGSQ